MDKWIHLIVFGKSNTRIVHESIWTIQILLYPLKIEECFIVIDFSLSLCHSSPFPSSLPSLLTFHMTFESCLLRRNCSWSRRPLSFSAYWGTLFFSNIVCEMPASEYCLGCLLKMHTSEFQLRFTKFGVLDIECGNLHI